MGKEMGRFGRQCFALCRYVDEISIEFWIARAEKGNKHETSTLTADLKT